MGIISKALPPLNIILTTVLTSIIVFDRHDEQQKKYIKIIWFLLGGAGIVFIYKLTELGKLVDETLESEIFDNIFPEQLT